MVIRLEGGGMEVVECEVEEVGISNNRGWRR